MKELLLVCCFIVSLNLVHGQNDNVTNKLSSNDKSINFKKIKVDISIGYAAPSSNGTAGKKGGVTFTVEPHYRLSNAIALGLRLEGAALGYINDNGSNSNAKISLLTSYCPTVEYYFRNKGFRPFAGVGIGLFTQASVNIDANSGSNTNLIPSASKFGFFPRLGFESGHFRLSSEYNILGQNANYLAAKIGFFFGGGKK